MTSVWFVYKEDYTGGFVDEWEQILVGVFSTEEKAKEYAQGFKKYAYTKWTVKEVELDKIIED